MEWSKVLLCVGAGLAVIAALGFRLSAPGKAEKGAKEVNKDREHVGKGDPASSGPESVIAWLHIRDLEV